MSDNVRQFLMAVDNLSEEARLYFEMDLSGELLKELNQKYQVNDDFFGDLEDEVVISGFDFDVLPEIKSKFGPDEQQAKKIATDFWGMLLLPISEYLPGKKINQEIVDLGGKLADYQNYIQRFNDAIEDYQLGLVEELTNKFDKLIDPKEEAEEMISLFNESLLVILADQDRESIFSLNQGLNYLLANDEKIKDALLSEIVDNQGRLGKEALLVGDKSLEPTIANWLRDFIVRVGSAYFDNVVLAEYSVNSTNAKKLSAEEKISLSRLLKLYRNLKFFTQVFGDVSIGQREIIPMDNVEMGDGKERIRSKTPTQDYEEVQLGEMTELEKRAAKEI